MSAILHDWQPVAEHVWQCSICGLRLTNRGTQPDEQFLVGECRGLRGMLAKGEGGRPGKGEGRRAKGEGRRPATADPPSAAEIAAKVLASLPADLVSPETAAARLAICQAPCEHYLARGACALRGKNCTAGRRWREAIALGSCERFILAASAV